MVKGTGDNFYKQSQLLPENFEKAVKDAGIEGVKLRYQKVMPYASIYFGNNADMIRTMTILTSSFLRLAKTTLSTLPKPWVCKKHRFMSEQWPTMAFNEQ